MKEIRNYILVKFRSHPWPSLFEMILKDESIGGKLIIGAALLSMIIVNSSFRPAYDMLWNTDISLGVGWGSLVMDLRHWISEGLMSVFFLVVGLEIKRELTKGKLRNLKTAVLPIGAALGGMIVPALIYLMFNVGTDGVSGWGIPIATDIAFAMAVIMLLGRRVPGVLKAFLLTLAIADDIGAIIVIALFYAEIIHYGYLAASVLLVIGIFLSRKFLTDKFLIVLIAGGILWITTHLSGIHASIVGAAMGLLAPVSTRTGTVSIVEKVERFFLPISTFLVLPLFAFANTGFILSSNVFERNTAVIWGILLGLVVGKTVGVTLFSLLLVKLGWAKLPENMHWRHVIGVGFIAGIGFTVSIFITELGFAENNQLIDTAKASIFIASACSALLGSAVLILGGRAKKPTS